MRTSATDAAKPAWPSSVCRPAAASSASTSATAALGAPAVSVGIDQVRSEPPWLGSSSTSTTVRPAAASTRWVVSSDR